MIEWLIYYFPMWLIILISLAKVILYFSFKSTKDKPGFLFYYPHRQIALTTHARKRNVKKLQNRLSIIVLVITIVYIALLIAVGERNELNPNEIGTPTTL